MVMNARLTILCINGGLLGWLERCSISPDALHYRYLPFPHAQASQLHSSDQDLRRAEQLYRKVGMVPLKTAMLHAYVYMPYAGGQDCALMQEYQRQVSIPNISRAYRTPAVHPCTTCAPPSMPWHVAPQAVFRSYLAGNSERS